MGEHRTVSRRFCLCDDCRAKRSVEYGLKAAERRARLAADPDCVRHGSASTYRYWGCRCDPCREAQSRAWAEYAKPKAAVE